MGQLLGLSAMKSNTQWAPLAVLGYRLQQRKFFEPLYQQLDLKQKQVFIEFQKVAQPPGYEARR